MMATTLLYGQDPVAEVDEPDVEPKLWTKGASFGLNVTNVTLNNWAGGGENSFAIAGLIKANATYQKDRVTWVNDFEAGYGVVRQGDITDFRKSDDRLIAVSKWSKSFGESDWAYTFLADFRTQMSDGYEYVTLTDEEGVEFEQRNTISRLLAPGYLTLAAGAEYKPSTNFYIMTSPLSGKVTFVNDPTLSSVGAFGVDTGKTIRTELGAILNIQWKKQLMDNIRYETKLNLFQAYRKDAFIDGMWDHLLELKVNNYFTSTISAQFIYDEDVLFNNEDTMVEEARLQSKFVINVGFLLKI